MGANFSGAAKNIYRLLNRINDLKLCSLLIGQKENELTKRVRELNLDVYIIPYHPALDIYGKKILNLSFSSFFQVLYGLLVYNKNLIKFFKITKPNVVWADNLRTFYFVYVAAKISGCKVILNIMSEPKGKVAWLLHRLSLLFADVVNLEYSRQAETMFGKLSKCSQFKRKMVTLYSGVTDFEIKNNTNIRDELSLSDNKILILMAANIVPGKGQLDLIKAVEKLKVNHSNVVILIAGRSYDDYPESVAYDETLKNYVRVNNLTNFVKFLGWRNDMPDLLNTVDIYASTSYSESLPDVIRDAMLAGKPIVATDVGGTFELVLPKNGYIFQPGDVKSLIKYLDILIMDTKLRETMGEEGKRIINKYYSTTIYARNFENMVLKSVYKV